MQSGGKTQDMDVATERKQWDICGRCGKQCVLDSVAIAKYGLGHVEKRLRFKRCPDDIAGNHPEMPVLRMPFVDGAYYRGVCRNARIARYVAAANRFVYMREKLGTVYPESIGTQRTTTALTCSDPTGLSRIPHSRFPGGRTDEGIPLPSGYAPRGHFLLADGCILRRKTAVRAILRQMHLRPKSAEIGTDSHYRCFECFAREAESAGVQKS